MKANELISLISVICSSCVGFLGIIVSIISLLLSRKDRVYSVKHADRLNEQMMITKYISEYASTMSVSKLATMLRRATAVKSEESVSQFMVSTEQLLASIDVSTVQVLSIIDPEIVLLKDDILDLKKCYIKTINEINDLKAVCVIEKITSTVEDDIAHASHDVYVELKTYQTKYYTIIDKLYEILYKYAKRVIWEE